MSSLILKEKANIFWGKFQSGIQQKCKIQYLVSVFIGMPKLIICVALQRRNIKVFFSKLTSNSSCWFIKILEVGSKENGNGVLGNSKIDPNPN